MVTRLEETVRRHRAVKVALIEQQERDDKVKAVIENVQQNFGKKTDLELALEDFAESIQ